MFFSKKVKVENEALKNDIAQALELIRKLREENKALVSRTFCPVTITAWIDEAYEDTPFELTNKYAMAEELAIAIKARQIAAEKGVGND